MLQDAHQGIIKDDVGVVDLARKRVRAVWALAAVYTLVGEQGAAIDRLAYLLSIPSPWSAWDLRLDPRWDPLRDRPRFEKLVGEGWQAEASTH